MSELKRRLTRAAPSMPNARGVGAAAYLSPPVRSRLTDAGPSYVDAPGNVRVELARPGLFLADCGADRDPWRGPGRPRETLKGEPAALVVRALADYDGRVRVASWFQALKAWRADYGLVASSRTTRWIAARGMPGLLDRIAQPRPAGEYAVTGTLAAAQWAPYAPASLAMVYVTDAEAAARAWGLQPTEAGAFSSRQMTYDS